MAAPSYQLGAVKECLRLYCGGSRRKQLTVLQSILSQPALTLDSAEFRRFHRWIAHGIIAPQIVRLCDVGDYLLANGAANIAQLERPDVAIVVGEEPDADVLTILTAEQRVFYDALFGSSVIDAIMTLGQKITGQTIVFPNLGATGAITYLSFMINGVGNSVYGYGPLKNRYVRAIGHWCEYPSLTLCWCGGWWLSSSHTVYAVRFQNHVVSIEHRWSEGR